MRCRAFLAAFLAAATSRVAGHPLCTDETPPLADQTLTFCEAEPDGVCCTDLDEDALLTIFQDAGALSAECADYYKQVVCGRCSPYSSHLYEVLWPTLPLLDALTMKKDFCNEFVAACTGQGNLAFPDYDDGETYCEKHTGTQSDNIYWSYPFAPRDFNTTLTESFPDVEPSGDDVLSVKQSPDGSMFWLVDQNGGIISVDASDGSTTEVINLGPAGTPSIDPAPGGAFHVDSEEGLIDVAFDPNFDNGSGAFYLSYTVKLTDDNKARNRLSKFQYTPGDPAATRASEEILLTTITKIAPIHSAGWVDFKPSDFANPGPAGSSHDIYWSIGDGGKKVDQQNRGQDPTNLLGSIVRITVSGTGTGYTTPAGNIASGGDPLIKEEICAYGFRNPFKCGFDQLTDELYCADVGHFSVEEVDLIECGQNYGWRQFEGTRCFTEEQSNCADFSDAASRAGYTFPYFQYCHSDFDGSGLGQFDPCGDRQITGKCIIGGYVYRGQLFSDVLGGAYIFGDNETKNIHYLAEVDGTITVGSIISDGTVEVIGFSQTIDGEMMVIGNKNGVHTVFDLPCGDLCATTCLDQSENVPTFDSEGCFVEVESDRALSEESSPNCPSGEDAMTAEICASYCATVPGMAYMGLHAGSECWCGGSGVDFGRHGTASNCETPCTARPQETCGGVDSIEVFSLGPPEATPAPSGLGGPVATPSPSGIPAPTPSGPPVATPSPSGIPAPTPSGPPVVTPSPSGLPAPTPSVPPTPSPSGTPEPVEPSAFTYIDCFQDQKNDRIMTLGTKANTMNAEKCFGVCSDSPFFATQYGKECWCGSTADYDRHGTSTACTVDCPGTPGDEICGGSYAASVYTNNEVDPSATPAPVEPTTPAPGATPAPVVPTDYTFIGCFQDVKSDRIMTLGSKSNAMETQVCASVCSESPFFGTEYGRECWCGTTDDYDRHGTSNGCTFNCAGNPDEKCGGFYTASVYSNDGVLPVRL